MTFDRALKRGRLLMFREFLAGRKNGPILSLSELRAAIPPVGETYLGLRDVALCAFAGTEGRSRDFSSGFWPLKGWMRERWNRVRGLMLSGDLTEPVTAFELGGLFFVRDGNHRVSVARAEGIEYLSAEVTRLDLPIAFGCGLRRSGIPALMAKLRFQEATGAIAILGEAAFDVRTARGWEGLSRSVREGHRRWFVQRRGREPGQRELVESWNAEIYASTVELIRRQALSRLFPGRGSGDIFSDIMEHWAGLPAETWFADAFAAYLRARKWRAYPLWLASRIRSFLTELGASPAEERSVFLLDSHLEAIRPGALLPEGDASWYRFLHGQLFGSHFRWLNARLGRLPEMGELTGDWYDRLLAPTLEAWTALSPGMPFPAFYRGLMRAWGRRVFREKRPLGLEDAIRSWLASTKHAS